MISILIMTRGQRRALPTSVVTIIRRTRRQASAIGQEIEFLVLDRAGVIVEHGLREFDQVQLLPCSGMRPAEARNLALRHASGAIVCFIDADCLPAEGWLKALVTPFQDERVDGVKGSYATSADNPLSRFVQLEYEARYRRLQELPSIDFVDMYSAAYRRSVLLANDGFDPRFGRLEEQELAYRLAARGYTLVFRREAQVQRRQPAGFIAYARNKAVIGYWKAQVLRLFPDRGMSDSYTPQALKIQIATLFTAGLLSFLSLFNSWLLYAALASLVLFVVSALPFLAMVLAEDVRILLLALPTLIVRAAALGAGYAAGVLRPAPGLGRQAKTIAGVGYLAKRLVDIIGSVLGLALTIILAPFISLAITFDSPGPVLFHQKRAGRGGKPFVLYKFRTMDVDAEDRLEDLIDLDELVQPAFKLADDPRITRSGRFLRRWSLDELPQFWNVLRGEMSLVGPRPEEERIVALYSDWHRKRLAVKPGMTGPMQIHGRGDLPLDQRVKLEIEYIEEYTLWRDMKILARTIPSILEGRGAS